MKKFNIFILSFIGLLICLGLFRFIWNLINPEKVRCGKLKRQIEEKFKKYNYCESTSDCLAKKVDYALGCVRYLNRSYNRDDLDRDLGLFKSCSDPASVAKCNKPLSVVCNVMKKCTGDY